VFLLDTNVISETNRLRPSSEVTAWINGVPQELQYVSAISLAEITRGATRHPDPLQRQNLQFWIDNDLQTWLGDGVLDVSKQIAEKAGQVAGLRDREGRPISFADALIAATAIDYGFTLVTGNTKDFLGLPLQILNPWTDTIPHQAQSL
jgi:predicted nucleic acid-binding protein